MAVLWQKHRHHLQHAFREDIANLFRIIKRPPRSPLIFFLVFVLALVLAPSVLAKPAPAGTHQAPSINIAPSEYSPLDEILYLEGKAEPGHAVELLFERIGGRTQPVRLQINANSNGEWFLAQKLELASGEWQVRARIGEDSPSDWSAPRIIRSVVSGFFLGPLRIKYAPVVGTLALLFLAAGGLLVYSILRVRRAVVLAREQELKERAETLEKELYEKEREILKTTLEDEFSGIRQKILGELSHFEEKARDGKLSEEEEGHRQKLLRELRDAEEAIEKKIKLYR